MYMTLKIKKKITMVGFLLLGLGIWLIGRAGTEKVIINELMVNPGAVSDSEGEWIELHNKDEETINLLGWKIKNRNGEHVIVEDLIIEPDDFLVLCRNKDTGKNGGIACDYQYSGLNLLNTGDEILLKSPEEEVWPAVYGQEMILEGKSLENTGDEQWQLSYNKLASGDYGTPGQENSQAYPEESEGAPEIPGEEPGMYAAIFLTEALPNPEGADGNDNEFIELYNPNDFEIDLALWKIVNKKGQEYVFDSWKIGPGTYKALYRNIFGLNLYNQDEEITLLNRNGRLVDMISFEGSAASGESLNKTPEGEVFWSEIITPGEAGIRSEAGKVESEEKSEQESFIQLENLEEIELLEDNTLVGLRGMMISPVGTPKKGAFYLQKQDAGILVELDFKYDGKPGDKLNVRGELRKLKDYNYIKVEAPENMEKTGAGKIEYQKINACMSDNSCRDFIGTAVEFRGFYARKTQTYLFFEDQDGRELRAALAGSLFFSKPQGEASYRIRGVLEENESGFRVVLVDQKKLKETIKQNEPAESANNKGIGAPDFKEKSSNTSEAGLGTRLIKDMPEPGQKMIIGENFLEQRKKGIILNKEKGKEIIIKMLGSLIV
ncbi:MAG: lamin tail domain-containing protein [Patescibacteria group bacterium]|nr:lamin tail domain-containing protein [Patescibacteria group bacterium]